MSHTSKKRRNKRIINITLIALVAILIISFFVSRSNNTVDPASFADVETFELEPRTKGNPEAELTLVEFSDFQCPACGQAYPIVKQVQEQYGDQFLFEYRHFPLRTIHPNAQLAAQASEAAGVQGKFWEMHDMLFERQSDWSNSFNPTKKFTEYAEELGLNADRFEYDLKSDEVKAKVNADADEAQALNLPGTPSFLVNGEVATFDEFAAMLDMSEPFEVPEETQE